MAELSERHEVRLRGKDKTITFIADSDDGRLVIRQEDDGRKAKDVCAITLSDPDELRGFFKGLRRIMASLGVSVDPEGSPQPKPKAIPAPKRNYVAPKRDDTTPEREAIIAEAGSEIRRLLPRGPGRKKTTCAGFMRRARPSRPSPACKSGPRVRSSCVATTRPLASLLGSRGNERINLRRREALPIPAA
jgi:hypothetical protein